jgi:scyllo-inositol 2-dehydrogenase (NADP+)
MAGRRVAILGYGLAGRVFHGPLIAATPGLEVAAIVTADPERAAAAAREHPGAAVLGDVRSLWQGPAVDLVVVATPNQLHAELAGEALEHDVPVVVDKPLAVTSAEGEALLERAQARGVLLTVFQNRRWDTDQLTLRRLLAEDALGEVVRYESRFERWRPDADAGKWRDALGPERGGGQLLDLGSHLIDQALQLFGPAVSVYAEVQARRGTPADDDVFLALRHTAGTISHLHAGAVMPAPGPRLRVQGTRAAFVLSGLDPQEAALREGRRPSQDGAWGRGEDWERGRLVAGERSVPVPSEPGDWPRFYSELERALREGGPPPVDPADAVTVLRVIEAARASAAAGTVVSLADR